MTGASSRRASVRAAPRRARSSGWIASMKIDGSARSSSELYPVMGADAALTYRNENAGCNRTEKTRSWLWSRRRAASSPDHGPGSSETTRTAPPSVVGRNSAAAACDRPSSATSVRARGSRAVALPYRRAAWTRQTEASSMMARSVPGGGPSNPRPSAVRRPGLIEIGRSSASMTITGYRRSRAPPPGGAMVDNRDNCIRACTKRFSGEDAVDPTLPWRIGKSRRRARQRRACRRCMGISRDDKGDGALIGAVSGCERDPRPKGERRTGGRYASPAPPGRGRRRVRSHRRRRGRRGGGEPDPGTAIRSRDHRAERGSPCRPIGPGSQVTNAQARPRSRAWPTSSTSSNRVPRRENEMRSWSRSNGFRT